MAIDEGARRYLDPATLVKISRLEIVARLVVEGFVTGRHKSPYHGFSIEFAEHREYVPGDDLRHVDWKVYARSDRYYVKQYEEETNLRAYLVLDRSGSMRYGQAEGRVTKWLYGCYVSCALAYLMLHQQDSVGLFLFDEGLRSGAVQALSRPSHLNDIIKEIDGQRPGGRTALGPVFDQVAEAVKRKGLIIIVSDLLGELDEVLRGIRQLRHRGHEVMVFHVLDDDELRFPFESMTRFEGLEGLPPLVVHPPALRQAYLREVETWQRAIEQECRAERVDYCLLDTRTSLDVALTRFLANRASRRGR